MPLPLSSLTLAVPAIDQVTLFRVSEFEAHVTWCQNILLEKTMLCQKGNVRKKLLIFF